MQVGDFTSKTWSKKSNQWEWRKIDLRMKINPYCKPFWHIWTITSPTQGRELKPPVMEKIEFEYRTISFLIAILAFSDYQDSDSSSETKHIVGGLVDRITPILQGEDHSGNHPQYSPVFFPCCNSARFPERFQIELELVISKENQIATSVWLSVPLNSWDMFLFTSLSPFPTLLWCSPVPGQTLPQCSSWLFPLTAVRFPLFVTVADCEGENEQ